MSGDLFAGDGAPEPTGPPGMGEAGPVGENDEGKGGGVEVPLSPLAKALADFRGSRRAASVAPTLPATRHLAKVASRKLDGTIARENRALRRLIRPENAEVLLPHLPTSEHERLHAVIPGNFIFCALVCAIVAHRGPPRSLTCATLSLSLKNVEALAALVTTHGFPFDLLLSHYFEGTNPKIFAALSAVAARCPLMRVRIARSHCKVTLFDYPEAPLVVESSANLRSSRNLEQVSIFADRSLFDFHRAWIETAALPAQ